MFVDFDITRGSPLAQCMPIWQWLIPEPWSPPLQNALTFDDNTGEGHVVRMSVTVGNMKSRRDLWFNTLCNALMNPKTTEFFVIPFISVLPAVYVDGTPVLTPADQLILTHLVSQYRAHLPLATGMRLVHELRLLYLRMEWVRLPNTYQAIYSRLSTRLKSTYTADACEIVIAYMDIRSDEHPSIVYS
jgi:hypothetical protein